MRRFLALLVKEEKALFTSPIAYVLIAAVALLAIAVWRFDGAQFTPIDVRVLHSHGTLRDVRYVVGPAS